MSSRSYLILAPIEKVQKIITAGGVGRLAEAGEFLFQESENQCLVVFSDRERSESYRFFYLLGREQIEYDSEE